MSRPLDRRQFLAGAAAAAKVAHVETLGADGKGTIADRAAAMAVAGMAKAGEKPKADVVPMKGRKSKTAA